MQNLKNYFALDGCTASTLGNSGYYLNRLIEGLEFKMLDYISNEQQQNFNGVWDDVQNRAIEMFKHDVRQEFNKRFRLKGLKQSVDNGKKIDVSITTAKAPQYRGFTLEMNQDDNTLVSSNLQQFYIQTISI